MRANVLKRGCSLWGILGSRKNESSNVITAKGIINRKRYRQEKKCNRKPEIAGPKMGAQLKARPIIPIICPFLPGFA